MTKSDLHLKDLFAIYPWTLVLLGIFPTLVGCFIDYSLVNSRDLITSLVWIPVFTIPHLLLRKRIILTLTKTLYFIVGIVCLSHWVLIKGPISVTSILVISNSNYHEAVDFFNLKSTPWLLILIPYVWIFITSIKQKVNFIVRPLRSFVLAAVLLTSTIFIAENALNSRLVRKGMPSSAKVAISFFQKIELYRESSKKVALRAVDASATFATDEQTFVLIIGESCNRNHMSLYGYEINTTPRLKKRDDLIVLDNVVSPYSNTLSSVLTSLSESNLENGIEITQGIDLIDVFHSAGFKTYWLSNQSPIGVWDNLVTVLANKSDFVQFVNISSNSSFESTYSISYDAKLLEPFLKILDEPIEKKFIVVHLMGSHSDYSKRYPSPFEVFQGSDDKSEVIAAYDNSILYSDFIVDSLLTMIAVESQKSKNSLYSAIYLADHGENVYDELDKVGHDYSGYLPKANVEVPFLFWSLDAFKMNAQGRIDFINANRSIPFVSDDLFHTVLDLNGINTSLLDKGRSLFSLDYNENRPRILEDNQDYDQK